VIEVATTDELSFLWGEQERCGQIGRGREEIYVGQVGKLKPKKRVDTIRKTDSLSARRSKLLLAYRKVCRSFQDSRRWQQPGLILADQVQHQIARNPLSLVQV
jgi:hypothetical protein